MSSDGLPHQVPESELDHLLEEKLLFLVDATGVPVLLSLLVLIFTAGGEDLTKLPSNRIELYELGIDSAISRRLLPGNRTNTDALIHDWLRLFNLDRSAMSATLTEGATEKKEREHRPARVLTTAPARVLTTAPARVLTTAPARVLTTAPTPRSTGARAPAHSQGGALDGALQQRAGEEDGGGDGGGVQEEGE
jgi:hypothetical protein